MDGRPFENDIRSAQPDRSEHRKARFREGWRKAVAGERYSEATLEELTWDNLGHRLGVLFGETSVARIDELYDWCVEQQRDSNQE